MKACSFNTYNLWPSLPWLSK